MAKTKVDESRPTLYAIVRHSDKTNTPSSVGAYETLLEAKEKALQASVKHREQLVTVEYGKEWKAIFWHGDEIHTYVTS